jgi:two-component system, chemotaxis family, CheB/CheR fusion protein
VKTYGWSEAEALTMNIRALIPEDQRKMSLAKVHEVAHAEVLAPYRAQRLAKDGSLIELWLTAAALVDAAGEPYAIATTERAVGRRKP